jgi:hypothetical protein
MLADRMDERSDPDRGPDVDKVAHAIRDAEIAQIAVFKLRECAARMETLAGAGQGSAFCEELRNVGKQLRRMEVALLRHAPQDE